MALKAYLLAQAIKMMALPKLAVLRSQLEIAESNYVIIHGLAS